MDYIRTNIDDMLTVRSIITVYDVDLRHYDGVGESHNFPEIIYVRKGFSDFSIDGSLVHLDAGQLVIVPPNAYHGPHETISKRDAFHSIFTFEVDSPLLELLYNRIITLNDEQMNQYMEIHQKGLSLFVKAPVSENRRGMIRHENATDYAILALKKQLELFLLDLYYTYVPAEDINRRKHKMQQLKRLTAYLQTHIKEKLTLEQMGRGVGMSTSTLRRLVTELCGCGPVNYFLDLKIAEAKHLIKEGYLNHTEIAESLGFETIHYFSRQFKKRVGLSPRDYSKQKKKHHS